MVEKIPKNIEHSRKVAEIVLDHPELKYDDLHAQTEKESEEKFNQRAREIFSKLEVVVHGMGNKAETGKEKQRGDIDGEAALGLLRKADIKFNKIEYIPKGQSQPGKIHIDTGNKNGIVIEKEKDGTATIYFDHHSPDFSLEPTSATQLIYEGLTGAGLLKEKPHLNKLVEFVTQVDNLSYPEEYYEEYPNYDRMLVGLWSHISFKHLEQFFLDDKLPTNILTPEEIRKYNLQKTSEAQKSHIERCLKLLPELEKDGFIIETDKYGKILVDIGGKLRPQGTIPAKYYSCDGYVMWMPDENGFLITVPGQDIDDDFIPGNKIRGSMWIKPKDDSSPRKITLGEILHKLSGGKLDPTGKLKEFLDTEKSKVYNENTVAETRESPEIPKSKVVDQLIDDLDASQADKLNSDLITSEAYKESLGVLDEARDLNLEDPKEALNHLLLSGLELISDDLYNQKIKELEGEQGIAQPETSPASGLNSILDNNPAHVESSPEQEPETHESVHIHTGPDGEVTETETEREVITPGTNQEAAQAIDNRIDEINKKLSEEVLPWSKAQEFKKEREALWTQKAGGPDRELAEEDKWTDEQIDRFIFNNERGSNPLGIEAEYWKGIKRKKAEARAQRTAGREGTEPAAGTGQIEFEISQKELELKKIEYMIWNAKATAKSNLGIGPEGLAYWQAEWDKKAAEIQELEDKLTPPTKLEKAKRVVRKKRKPAQVTTNPFPETSESAQPTPEPQPQPIEAEPARPEIQEHPEIVQPVEPEPDVAGETPINPPSPEPETSTAPEKKVLGIEFKKIAGEFYKKFKNERGGNLGIMNWVVDIFKGKEIKPNELMGDKVKQNDEKIEAYVQDVLNNIKTRLGQTRSGEAVKNLFAPETEKKVKDQVRESLLKLREKGLEKRFGEFINEVVSTVKSLDRKRLNRFIKDLEKGVIK